MNQDDLEKFKVEMTKLENKYELTKESLESILRQLDHSFINSIDFRVKKISSIQKKLVDRGYHCTLDYVDDFLSDIVGARIVCPFLSDVDSVIQSLMNHPKIKVLISKNYIDNPKENGYSSYHMIVNVPVIIDGKSRYVKAEIQIRTMLQDVWASLEHKIRYKKDVMLSGDAQRVILNAAKEFRALDINLNEKYLEEKKKSKSIPSTAFYSSWMSKLDELNLINKYEYAMKEVFNRIEYLKNMYDLDEEGMVDVNPIEHITCRIKPFDRMLFKLMKKTNDFSISSLEENVLDIAGVRVVCSFESDLYKIVDDLRCYFNVVLEKDYVSRPKKSGYAGYHLIVSVPVSQGNCVNVEIQVRTVAMDMWASLEDNLCYQKDASVDTKKELVKLAFVRKQIDQKMEEIIEEVRGDKKHIKKLSS